MAELEPETAALQLKIDQFQKRIRILEDQLAGKVPQVDSSGPLHNYPEAGYEMPEEGKKVEQPRSGASAIAKEE